MKDRHVIHHFPLPYLGHRIIKTAVAVFCCLLIHMLLDYGGMALQSAIAAIVCMRPYIEDTKKYAFDRVAGTVIGGAWGVIFLFLTDLVPALSSYMILVYFLMALEVLIVIYSTVVLKLQDAAGLSAIVFLCVVIGYPRVETPMLLAGSRILDTLIGIVVAIVVNVVKFPRKKRKNCLFFVQMKDLVPNRYGQMSSGVLISLNRLFSDGAQICLVSPWAPAFVLTQVERLETDVPAIVMDGAALYDFRERNYLEILEMDKEDAAWLCRTLKEMDLGYCVYAVRDRTTLIYRQGNLNEAEKKEYDIMKRSHLRNYVNGFYTTDDKITFVRLIDTDERINQLEKQLQAVLPEGRFRIVKREQPGFPNYSGLYFYAADATVEHMKAIMLTHYNRGCERVDVLPARGHYDVERDAIHLLHRVHSIYAPLGLMK